jgi:hypothetical protein
MQLSLRAGMVAIAAVLAFALPPAIVWMRGSSTASPASASGRLRVADFGAQIPSTDARRLADWIASTRDNAGASFAIIDKKFARLHIFDGAARLQGSSPILIGAAIGDDSVPGIGLRPIAAVRPEERTTPAGRFVVERGRNLRGEDVVWVSYADSVSMHPVLTERPEEHRLERLQTPSLDDKRISYGCINVPTDFYEAKVLPAFARSGAVVYVLPELKTIEQVFAIPALLAS